MTSSYFWFTKDSWISSLEKPIVTIISKSKKNQIYQQNAFGFTDNLRTVQTEKQPYNLQVTKIQINPVRFSCCAKIEHATNSSLSCYFCLETPNYIIQLLTNL